MITCRVGSYVRAACGTTWCPPLCFLPGVRLAAGRILLVHHGAGLQVASRFQQSMPVPIRWATRQSSSERAGAEV